MQAVEGRYFFTRRLQNMRKCILWLWLVLSSQLLLVACGGGDGTPIYGNNKTSTLVVFYPFSSNTNPSLNAGYGSTSDYSHSFDFYIGDDGFGNVLEAYPLSGSTSHDTALSTGSFFSISATAPPGGYLDLEKLEFEVGKGGNTDPRGYFVRSSVNNFGSDIFAAELPSGSHQSPALQTIDLTGLSTSNLSSIEFRFYIYTPDPAGAYSVDFRNWKLYANTQ